MRKIKFKSILFSLSISIYIILLISTSCFAVSQKSSYTTHTAQSGSIKIVMVGIKNNTGMMRIGLFNSASAYSDMRRPAAPLAFRKGSAPINNQQSQIIFKNVPYGIYAVKLYQDERMAGHLVRNFIGKPLEGVGISNNPQIKRSLPSWDQAKFVLDQPKVMIVIQMQNF